MAVIITKATLLLSILLGQHCKALAYPALSTKLVSSCYLRRHIVNPASSNYPFVTALHSAAAEPNSDKASLIKLPILQIIKGSEITGEFICGHDLPTSVEKFQATLSSLEKKTSGDSLSKSGNYGVRNIYSEEQLADTLAASENYVILKLFREGCKKCALLEPIIDDLSRDPLYSKFVFLQADVSNVEKYTADMKERLLGLRGGNTGDCATCLDSGFIECTECLGKGYIQKGALAAFCPTCSGYKKTRCTTCGGKCLKCG